MKSWKQYIEDVGEVTFRRSERSRYLRLSVKADKEIRVSLPVYVSVNEGIRFVKAKKQWILKGLEKADRVKENSTVFSEDSSYQTKYHSLELLKHDKATIKTVISKGKISVIYPEYADFKDGRIQQAIKKAFIEAWRVEAKWYLPKRTRELAQKHGFRFNNVAVKNNKTRWGSCSGKNNINLNIHLMRLPDHLIDYVILHELAHTVHKHHQKTFWATLDHILGNSKIIDRQLNKYHIETW